MDQSIGRYQLIKELGRGGMATVFLAKDPRFNRDVAIKVLPREFLHDPQFRTRFVREAQTIATLEHPAIVPVYDFSEEGDQPYIVMRYMPGGSLAEKIAAGAMSLPDAASIVKRIAGALDSAHQRGIIHRDLKPGNILFDQYNNAYLSDFGIVKLAEQTQTITGNAIIGTPAYMSPEQAQGNRGVDARTDVYALGIILFEMLTGTVPYGGDTPVKQLMQHIMDPVPRILQHQGDLPAAIETVLDNALAKNPDERYASTVALALALDGVTSGEGGGLSPETLVDHGTLIDAEPVVVPTPPPSAPVGQTLMESGADAAASVSAGATMMDAAVPAPEPAAPISYTPITSGTGVTAKPAKKRPAWLFPLLGLVAIIAIGGGLFASGILGGGGGTSAETTPTPDPAIAAATNTPEPATEEPVVAIDPTEEPAETPTEIPEEAPPTEEPNEPVPFASPGDFGDGGSLIAFQSQQGGGTWNIVVMNLDGSDRRILTDESGNDMRPRWSPDGQWLTFRSDRTGNEDVWMMRPDGNEIQPLINGVLDEHTGTWSPDGTQLAYHADFGDGIASIATVFAGGGEPVRLTSAEDGTSFWPSWSPDGTQLVFWTLRNNDLAEIYLMDADGSNQRVLLGGEGAFLDPVWSPVSNEIGYYSWATGRAELFTVSAETGAVTPIDSGVSGNNILSDWSPDGDYMLIHTDFHGADEIYRVRLDGSEESERLTKTGADDQHPVWQPINRAPIEVESTLPDPTSIRGSLRVWHAFEDVDRDNFETQMDRFQAEHPNVALVVEQVSGEQVQGAFSAENGPDIAFGPIDWGMQFADFSRGPMALLNERSRAQIDPAAIDRVTVDGKPVGVPYVSKSIVLVRNTSLIPDAPQSLVDLLAIDSSLIDLERGFYYSGGSLLAQGGQLADTSNQPSFADAQGAGWLTALTQFNDPVSYGDEDLDAFKNGEVGLVLDGSWNLGSLAAAVGRENMAVDPWPEGMSGWVLYDMAYVNAQLASENEAAAGALLDFLVTDETQLAFSKIGRIPVVRNLPIENPLLRQTAIATDRGVPFPLVRGMDAYWGPITVAINAALDDGVSPIDALSTAQEQVARDLP